MRNFHDELRRPLDVAVVTDVRLPARVRVDAKQGVGLRLVVEVETNRRIISDRDVRGCGGVYAEPGDDLSVRCAVGRCVDGRGHVDSAFDELGRLDVWRCLVAHPKSTRSWGTWQS